MSDEGELRRVHATVAGRVQGVGFRWFVRRTADQLSVAGWVRNLPDGRVDVEAVGAPDAIASFLDRVRQGPAGARVDRVDVTEGSSVPEHSGFAIRP